MSKIRIETRERKKERNKKLSNKERKKEIQAERKKKCSDKEKKINVEGDKRSRKQKK